MVRSTSVMFFVGGRSQGAAAQAETELLEDLKDYEITALTMTKPRRFSFVNEWRAFTGSAQKAIALWSL